MILFLMEKKGSHQIYAENLKLFRDAKGLSQKDLGLALGFNEEHAQQRISQYENWTSKKSRFPRPEMMDKISDFLGKKLQDFFVDSGDISSNKGDSVGQDNLHKFSTEKKHFRRKTGAA